jgi:GNAT superfamily N-acetyltransferase
MEDVNQGPAVIRPVGEHDRPTVEWLTIRLWGSCEVLVHEGVFHPAGLPGFIAERSGRIAGLVTFEVRPGVLEIVTINALEPYQGIGTQLIEAVRDEARRLGRHQVILTTTNDNIGALRFYQRRGFRLAAIRPGAVDRSRQRQPEIPRTGDFGIPLRDEIDLACPVLAMKISVATHALSAYVLSRARSYALYRDLPLSEGATCCHPVGPSPRRRTGPPP